MSIWLSGTPVAAAIHAETAALTARLNAHGISTALAVVRLGEEAGDVAYEGSLFKRCSAAGISVRNFALPRAASEAELLSLIVRINKDRDIHGALLLRPFPAQIHDRAVRQALDAAKDVDGMTDASLAGVFTGSGTGFSPCTAEACVELLAHYQIDCSGKRVCVIGRSLVVGRPVAMLLLRQNATVTICHTHTENVAACARESDILVAAAGVMHMIGPAYTNPQQIILDVGMHTDPSGRLCGDVDCAAVAPLVQAITPVPGGVGSVTAALLLRHTALAAVRQQPF